MVIFHSYVNVYQRVKLHFPMVFQWFSIKTSIFLWFSGLRVTTQEKPKVHHGLHVVRLGGFGSAARHHPQHATKCLADADGEDIPWGFTRDFTWKTQGESEIKWGNLHIFFTTWL